MRLTASTRLLDKVCKPFSNEIEIMKDYGFEGIDFDLNFSLSGMLGDGWEKTVEETAQKAAALNMPIVQTHLPYKYMPGAGPIPVEDEMVREAIDATAILGSKYAVFHACSPADVLDAFDQSEKVYAPHIEYAAKKGVELLVEIMPNYCTYPITAEALVDCADRLGIGICWDFGHPNVNKRGLNNDQRDSLRIVGSRLKALHVNDNAGGRPDEHLPPYMGTVDWDTHIPVLKEIGYSGDFNFEVLPRNVPGYAVKHIADYLVDVGRKLIDLCN